MIAIPDDAGSRGAVAVRMEGNICHLVFDRPEANNAINARLVAECHAALDSCEDKASVVVLSGSADVFCFGADFTELSQGVNPEFSAFAGPGPMFDLWQRLATGPYVTVSYVRGKVNAGGMGFLGASDIVLADASARFSLSEMLFGLYPACVMPFLVRRTGFQRAHFLTLSTQPVDAATALAWGLADAVEEQGEMLLRRHLRQLGRLSKMAIARYKNYARGLAPDWEVHRERAIAGNLEVFEDVTNRAAIARYVNDGLFPWE